MPLLGGLFSRKSRSRQQVSSVTSSVGAAATDDLDSDPSSPTASYVTPDKYVPSVPNGKSYLHPDSARNIHTNLNGHHPSSLESMPSTSKLRIFGRKKSSIKPKDGEDDHSIRPPFLGRVSMSSAVSDTEMANNRRLRPPPSKSAIFAAYADPHSALSTRSLPNEDYHTRSQSPAPALPAPPPPPPQATKRPSLFAWTKSSSTKTVSVTTSKQLKSVGLNDINDNGEPSTFNLKSFRHVGPTTPSQQSNTSNVSLHTPLPRPRADTVHSESSQRISVAAFREAQARRSLAGSPSPSLGRSPSPLPNSPPLPSEGRSASQSRPTHMASSPTSPTQAYSAPLGQHRKSGMSFAATSLFASDTDDSDSSSEQAESDDDGTYTLAQRGRQANARNASNARAKSDMGHGGLMDQRPPVTRSAAKSHLGHERPNQPTQPRPQSQALLSDPNTAEERVPRSQSSLGTYTAGSRPRASASTSALTPSAAAKRASVIAAANVGTETDALDQYKQASRHVRDSSILSNPGDPSSMNSKKASTHLGHGNFQSQQLSNDSDSDSDNAPLATLMPPRRPGSAMSSYSSGNISTRSTGAPHKPLIDIKELTGGSTVANKSGSAPTIKPFSERSKPMDGFTPGQTLLSGINGMPPKSQNSVTPPSMVSKIPPFKFISPPSTPGQEDNKKLGMPPRSATMPLPISTSHSNLSGKESSPESERKRDALSERLSKVVKSTVGPSHLNPERSPSLPPLSISSSSTPINDSKLKSPDSPSRSLFLGTERSTSPQQGDRTSKASVQTASPAVTRNQSTTPDMTVSTSSATIRARPISKPSPPDLGLADLLGAAGMKLISRNGETSSPSDSESETSESSESESDEYGYDSLSGKKSPLAKPSKAKAAQHQEEADQTKENIVPIPIKQRQPAPSFSVTSRPQVPRSPVKENNTLSTVSSTSGSSSGGSVLGASTSKSLALNTTSLPPSTSTSSFNTTRKRSNTLTASPTSSTLLSPSPPFVAPNTSSSRSTPPPESQASTDRTSALRAVGATMALQPQPRQRSSTLVSMQGGTPPPHMPSRPFAARRDSPASSTGDSSSGRAPLTPRDGSDIGVDVRNKEGKPTAEPTQYSGGASGLGVNAKPKQRPMKRRSVSFEQDAIDSAEYRSSHSRMSRDVPAGRNGSDLSSAAGAKQRSAEVELEERRKERRREEAKAAIELGEVVNGRGPILDDDDVLSMNQINPRLSTMNPMMLSPMGMQQPGAWGMNMPMNAGMLSPAQYMIPRPPSTDPNFLVAHQQAMMIAKQAYQMAVAQQAMAAAADEWERSSNIGGYSGSVYGGAGGSTGPGSMIGPYGMMGMGMGMGMSANNWSTGSAIMAATPRSMYGGIGSSRSEYGGGMVSSGRGGGGGNWSSTRSSYGEQLGVPSGVRGRHVSAVAAGGGGGRESMYGVNMPPVPPIPSSASPAGLKGGQRPRTASTPNGRKAPPPSSWKASGF